MSKTFYVTIIILLSISMPAFAGLPDTGQTKCYDNESKISCPQPGGLYYGQDAQYGPNLNSYTKLGDGGVDLPDNATEWIMVRDNVTGLIWENKTDDGSIHDVDYYYYHWEIPDSFLSILNTGGFGGFHDWRLPNEKELSALIRSDRWAPSIDTAYFPNTPGCPCCLYWSSNYFGSSFTEVAAWACSFDQGTATICPIFPMSHDALVRAVRGAQSSTNLIDDDDGTVTDTSTGLMWQQATAPATYSWEQALSYGEDLTLAGYSDWRLPNRNELQSLVDYTHWGHPIDTAFFPNTEASYYWSSTTNASDMGKSWTVDFDEGYVAYLGKLNSYYVRAVRGGQCGETGDLDGDTVCDDVDNCPQYNPRQEDIDNDTLADACDNCPETPNTGQLNFDNDTLGDVCDNCTDTDHDGYGNPGFVINTCPIDNCPYIFNPDQSDDDKDAIGNACDPTPVTTTTTIGNSGGGGGTGGTSPPPVPEPECLDTSDCDDGLFCNGSETCYNNKCISGTPPCPPSGPPCFEEIDECIWADISECFVGCDDNIFCNGLESCDEYYGDCAAGDPPCTPDQLCMETLQECWDLKVVTAQSLQSTLLRPLFLGKRCTFLVLKPDTPNNFAPDKSAFSLIGPTDEASGVSINERLKPFDFFGYVLVPICIKKDATVGQWKIAIETDVQDSAGPFRETIEAGFEVR